MHLPTKDLDLVGNLSNIFMKVILHTSPSGICCALWCVACYLSG